MIARIALVLTATIFLSSPVTAGVRAFFSPTVGGMPVAACLTESDTCGKPAADAFCRSEGYDRSVLFERRPASAARTLGSGETCSGGTCTAFHQVKCFSVKDDLASLKG